MFKAIVLALDGSEGSQQAISVANELAERYDARIVVAHVDEKALGRGGGGSVHLDEPDIQARIRQQAEELRALGREAVVEVGATVLGGPAHVIEDIAEDVGADLIVVGTRGHSPVAGLLLGSVTQRLLHIAKRPVLVVPSTRS